MPVDNGAGTIGLPGLCLWNPLSWFNPAAWVPCYGNWGGPNWSGGQVGGNPLTANLDEYGPVDKVDEYCMVHDFA